MYSNNFKIYSFIITPIAVAIIAVAFLLSYNLPNIQDLKTLAQQQTPAKSKEGLQVGNTAPDFNLIDPQKGGIIAKQTFNGKPLFIFFTTTYCTPCQIGAENLGRYDDETGGSAFNVLIVFIDDRETDNQFIEWKQKYGRNDWFVAKGINMAQTYNVQYLDTKYVFDKNGIIKWIDIKPLEYSSIKPVLGPLL
jgi:thiol-disulfide isomerase/thioredoxin